jgi:outer membrane protein X
MAIAIIATTMCLTTHAQKKGDLAAGLNLVLGIGSNSGVSYTNIGVGAKFLYNVIDPIRLEGSFTYFLEKDFVSMWDFSMNGHFLLPLTDQITVYPLAGLGIFGTKVDFGLGAITDSNICVNLGAGIDYKLSDQFFFNAEMKFKFVNNWNRQLLSAGITYKF